MRISIRVKPNSKEEGVERLPDGSLLVSVRAQASDGKANEATLRALAKHFHVAPSCISIVSGASSRIKRVKVLT